MTTLPEGDSNPGPFAWGADALQYGGLKGYCFGGCLHIYILKDMIW